MEQSEGERRGKRYPWGRPIGPADVLLGWGNFLMWVGALLVGGGFFFQTRVIRAALESGTGGWAAIFSVNFDPLLLGGGFGVAVLGAAGIMLRDYRRAARLETAGRWAEVALVAGGVLRRPGRLPRYILIYEIPGLGWVRQAVPEEVYVRFRERGRLRLRYLPDDPTVFRPDWDG